MSYKHSIRGGGLMRVTITSESGDWKANLYTKDIDVYEVKNQEILDFFIQLGDAYANNDTVDDMFECLYNLINYGYLYTDEDTDDNYYDDFDYDEDYFDYDYLEEHTYISQDGFKLIKTEVEYYVDDELVTKDAYDDAWDDRIGYLGSANWEDRGLTIINTDTDEVIFLGRIS
jgi:hypothetical protein